MEDPAKRNPICENQPQLRAVSPIWKLALQAVAELIDHELPKMRSNSRERTLGSKRKDGLRGEVRGSAFLSQFRTGQKISANHLQHVPARFFTS